MKATTIGEGRFFRLVTDGHWEHVTKRRPGPAVAVIAVTEGGGLVLVEQRRPPVDTTVIELPAGLAGDINGREDESLEDAAQRELVEETGWSATRLVALCDLPTAAGVTDEIIRFFRAEGIVKVGAGGGDDSESIIVHEAPLARIDEWLEAASDRGAMIDPKLLAGLWLLSRDAATARPSDPPPRT